MTGIALREGGIDDVDSVMAIMARAFDPAFGEAWTRGQCLGMLSLPEVWLLLAMEGDRPLGFALSRLIVDEVELLLLAVDPARRGQGNGRRLVEHTIALARARGARRLLLEMRAGNPAAGLYGAVGFERIGERRSYYRGAGGQTADAWTLARAIA